ncbi:MAG: hypothetical protein MRJ66_14425 [Nitrospira sp.]|nr:hypothetical protein [Nitrospira sp.]
MLGLVASAFGSGQQGKNTALTAGGAKNGWLYDGIIRQALIPNPVRPLSIQCHTDLPAPYKKVDRCFYLLPRLIGTEINQLLQTMMFFILQRGQNLRDLNTIDCDGCSLQGLPPGHVLLVLP